MIQPVGRVATRKSSCRCAASDRRPARRIHCGNGRMRTYWPVEIRCSGWRSSSRFSSRRPVPTRPRRGGCRRSPTKRYFNEESHRESAFSPEEVDTLTTEWAALLESAPPQTRSSQSGRGGRRQQEHGPRRPRGSRGGVPRGRPEPAWFTLCTREVSPRHHGSAPSPETRSPGSGRRSALASGGCLDGARPSSRGPRRARCPGAWHGTAARLPVLGGFGGRPRFQWSLYWEMYWVLRASDLSSTPTCGSSTPAAPPRCPRATWPPWVASFIPSIATNACSRTGGRWRAPWPGHECSLTPWTWRSAIPDAHFDHAFSICVFEHLDYDVKQAALREIARCLKPGGLLALTFDYRNPAPGVVGVGKDPRPRNALGSEADLHRNFLGGGQFEVVGDPLLHATRSPTSGIRCTATRPTPSGPSSSGAVDGAPISASRLSVIVSTYNRRDLLAGCLKSLGRRTTLADRF